MSSPASPSPSGPRAPESQHDVAAPDATAQADAAARPRGARRRPSPAVVAGGLVVIVLVLSLAAFLGVRMLLGDGSGDQEGSPAAVAQLAMPAEVPLRR
ncbi:hypothetical protein ACT3SP_00490 [Brachybacterium sp. AOP43-C2-M15]|uniref:hypothetical protein n=1 Tax=Brachybacterium sp. AOP43-C2-M15 TaxID=3457661 RepID=UPI004034B7F8